MLAVCLASSAEGLRYTLGSKKRPAYEVVRSHTVTEDNRYCVSGRPPRTQVVIHSLAVWVLRLSKATQCVPDYLVLLHTLGRRSGIAESSHFALALKTGCATGPVESIHNIERWNCQQNCHNYWVREGVTHDTGL